MAHRLIYWEDKEKTFEESKKSSSRTEFKEKSFGAYRVAKKNGWLDEMTWLNRKNVYKDPVDCVYKYHFVNENAVYIGRTIYPELRDKQHRLREKDSVNRFAKEHNTEIPKMEIIEDKLTVVEGAKREVYWEKYYRDNGFHMINAQPCGSLGLMCRGKWSKEKCFEEAKKYKLRSEFQKNASQAYAISMQRGWIKEMTWFPKNREHTNGYWKNKENFLKEAKKYSSKNELAKGNLAAYTAGRKYGYLNEVEWKNERKVLPYGYWMDKEHVMEEAKKYSSKIEFQKKNQSAYGAALKYGYLEEMPWLIKHKISHNRGFFKNKEFIMKQGKKYKTRGDFQKHDKPAYNAALKYGWLDEMYWMPKDKKFPRGYWSNIENVINETKKFKTKKEIKENNPYLYKIISKKGYIEELDWLK
jgi:hypothetical protein